MIADVIIEPLERALKNYRRAKLARRKAGEHRRRRDGRCRQDCGTCRVDFRAISARENLKLAALVYALACDWPYGGAAVVSRLITLVDGQ